MLDGFDEGVSLRDGCKEDWCDCPQRFVMRALVHEHVIVLELGAVAPDEVE